VKKCTYQRLMKNNEMCVSGPNGTSVEFHEQSGEGSIDEHSKEGSSNEQQIWKMVIEFEQYPAYCLVGD
jgi:hypothetical protein